MISMRGDASIVIVKNNHDHGYLDLLKCGLEIFPENFTLSPQDPALHEFPTKNPLKGFTLGYLNRGVLCGVVTFTVMNDHAKLSHVGEISRMYVANEGKRPALANRLLVTLVRMVQEEFPGVLWIRVKIASINNKGKRLYTKFKFQLTTTENNVIRIGNRFLDEDTMVLTLTKSQSP